MSKDIPTNTRLTTLDVTKGFILIIMASLHCGAFFSQRLTSAPFLLLDPFIFPSFLLYFGIGNSLSRRPKRLGGLGKLLVIYLLGGLPSAVVTYLKNHKGVSASRIPAIAYEQLVDAVTLKNRLEYANFLVPFIVAFAIFLGIQFLFKEFNRRTLAVALGLSVIFYVAGDVLAQVAPDSPFQDLYSQDFRCLQSMPIFIAGICLGLFLRQNGKIPVLKPQTLAGITLIFFVLIITSYLQYDDLYLTGNSWKKSGQSSYVLFSIIVSILLLFIANSVITSRLVQERFSLITALLQKIGNRALKCLWIQFLLFPIAGYLVSSSFIEPLRMLLALAAIGLMCWLTVDDQLSWSSQRKKRS